MLCFADNFCEPPRAQRAAVFPTYYYVQCTPLMADRDSVGNKNWHYIRNQVGQRARWIRHSSIDRQNESVCSGAGFRPNIID